MSNFASCTGDSTLPPSGLRPILRLCLVYFARNLHRNQRRRVLRSP
jgi:hypothetical protein